MKEIINQCKVGNQQAYKKLYELHIGYAITVCRRYQVNEESLKDMVQEIFAEVFFCINKYDESKGEFIYWFRKICVNTIIKKNRKKVLTVIDINRELENELTFSPDYQMDKNIIYNAIEKLPDGYRTIFNMAVIDGLSHDEISKLLGISITTSRSQLSRAKKVLKKKLIVLSQNYNYGTL